MDLSVGDVAVIGAMAHEQTHSRAGPIKRGSVDIAVFWRGGDCESAGRREEKWSCGGKMRIEIVGSLDGVEIREMGRLINHRCSCRVEPLVHNNSYFKSDLKDSLSPTLVGLIGAWR